MNPAIRHLQNFRQELYNLIPKRADAAMELTDSLSSNTEAGSAVQLSMNSLFRRTYNSIYDAIKNFFRKSEDSCEEEKTGGVPEQSKAAGDTKQSGAAAEEKNADAKPAADEDTEQAGPEARTDAAKEAGTKNTCSGAAAKKPENRPPVRRFEQKLLSRLIAEYCAVLPETRPFHLFGLDCTPVLRPFADTLPVRGMAHAANPAPGNWPVGAGHEYSALAWLPEKTENTPPWAVPLSFVPVPFSAKGHVFGMAQLSEILNDETTGFSTQLCVVVGDTSYSAPGCRQQAAEHDNPVLTARIRGDRAVYRQPEETEPSRSGGHPAWYGKKMKPDDEASLDPPDSGSLTVFITKKGRKHTVIAEHGMTSCSGERAALPRMNTRSP